MKQQGFTLIEVLLSLAIVGLLTAISLPVLSRIQTKNDIDVATQSFVFSLRRASVLAQAVDGDTSWGVGVLSGNIVLFKGESYVARDTTYDEVFPIPLTVTPSGLTEIVMNKFTGYPVSTGSTILTSSVDPSDTATVTINGKGMVEY